MSAVEPTYDRMKVSFNRLQTQGVIYGLTYPALFALMFAVGVGSISVMRDGILGVITSSPIWAPVVFLGVVKRRGVPLIVILFRNIIYLFRKTAGNTVYQFTPEDEIEVEVMAKNVDPALLPVRSFNIPGRNGRLDFYQLREGAVIVHDTIRKTATVAALVATDPFLGRSPQDQDAMVSEWSQVIGSWTMRPSIKYFSVLEQVRPGTTAASQAHWLENAVEQESEAARDYAASLVAVEAAVVLHRTMLTITLDLKVLGKEIKANGGGVKGLLAVARQEIAATTDTLIRASFTKVAWLTAREYAAWGRGLLDPEYSATIDSRSVTEQAGVDPSAAGVMAIDSSRDAVATDSGFHRTYWIHQWPRMETYPGFLEHVFFAELPNGEPVRHTFNLVSRPVGVDKALKRIDDEKKAWRANEKLRMKTGREVSEADKADWQNLLAQEQALVAGHGEVQFSAFLTVTGRTPQELEASCSAMRAAMSRSQLEAQVLYTQQAEAVLMSAYPTGLGMR